MTACASTATAGTARAADAENRYLTCLLENEVYGVEITKVREIIGIQKVTRVPRTPDFVEGVINLRGKVVPVVDLRRKFGLPAAAHTRETCIIVVEVHGTLTGVIVDTVIEVVRIAGDRFNPVPSFGGHVDVSYIRGICKTGDRVTIVLEIENVISREEMHALASAV